MDRNEIHKLIKKTKRKSRLISIILILAAFAILFLLESPIKYFIAVMLILINIILTIKIQNVSYLLYDQCNPQLYYAVTQGLTKEVPPNMQAVVAEFIGDYSSAIQIYNTMLAKSKNELIKLTHITDITRNAFFDGDYDLCKKSITDFNELIKGKKIDVITTKRNEFYLSYINGDYQKAKELLNEFNRIVKNQKNSFKCSMLYYNALVDYAMNNFDLAEKEFQDVTEQYPNMYLSAVSKNYIDSIRNHTPLEVIRYNSSELPESAVIKKVAKKDILIIVISLFVILGCIIGLPTALNFETAADTPSKAIEKYDDYPITSIMQTIPIDSKHIVAIYENADELLGVAYLQIKGEKYICKIANMDDYPLIDDDENNHPAKMHISGVSSEIVYKCLYDKSKAPADYKSVPIAQNGKTLYFCYKINPPQRYFTNLYKVELDE